MTTKYNCFVAMPFTGPLNFFYNYLKIYLEREFDDLTVERGDTHKESESILEKLKRQIQKTDFVIGDLTDNNPNVLFELGLAEAWKKPKILITSNKPEEAPVNIRLYEAIPYTSPNHLDFLDNLKNAVKNIIAKIEKYNDLYSRATDLLASFNQYEQDTALSYTATRFDDFRARVEVYEKQYGLLPEDDERTMAYNLLRMIIEDPPTALENINEWMDHNFPEDP